MVFDANNDGIPDIATTANGDTYVSVVPGGGSNGRGNGSFGSDNLTNIGINGKALANSG